MNSVVERIYLAEGRYRVSAQALTTPKAVHRLSDISSVSVRYEVAVHGLVPAIAVLCGTLGFARYLYTIEIIALLIACGVIAVLSVSVGTLTVNSLALAHAPELRQTWGRIDQLKRVRNAVATAIAEREQRAEDNATGLHIAGRSPTLKVVGGQA